MLSEYGLQSISQGSLVLPLPGESLPPLKVLKYQICVILPYQNLSNRLRDRSDTHCLSSFQGLHSNICCNLMPVELWDNSQKNLAIFLPGVV